MRAALTILIALVVSLPASRVAAQTEGDRVEDAVAGDGVAAARPFLIATVTDAQAKEFGQRPRFLAAYWRDLLRDVIELSRGADAKNSALSAELADELLEARHQMGDAANVKNLHQVLKRLTASKALKLSDVFLQVPDRAFSADQFPEVDGFEPLKS